MTVLEKRNVRVRPSDIVGPGGAGLMSNQPMEIQMFDMHLFSILFVTTVIPFALYICWDVYKMIRDDKI